ncbi:hypothetical protein [Dyadobacter sp. CY312]|uniref:hypothetical protein n=1 Tax=Dyadobacter sp. CY312 TaxID=2907303 RepID=UPI001F4821D2|nr:hypothetical protein [Dyadobacter sp. CY312]MCE7039172.1 hypothetical protein [Dyadobacter sp. CY312]
METIQGKTLEEWIESETSFKKVSLWGQSTEFVPVICSTILGDGLQLVYLGSTGQRPLYWLIRIDSETDINADDFDHEQLICTVEDDFGRHPGCILDEVEFEKHRSDIRYDLEGYDSFEEYEADCDYPHLWWDGGHWGLVVNFGDGEIGE